MIAETHISAVGSTTFTSWVGSAGEDRWSPFQEKDWIKYTASALRGSVEQIRSVGGTVLPDGEKASYSLINGWLFKQYKDKNGLERPENQLRNPEWIDESYRWVLDTLVNGEYAKNSRGETYGVVELGDYVGYYPDLGVRFADIRDTRTLPTDFDAYAQMAGADYICPMALFRDTKEAIDARKDTLRNSY